MDFKNRVSINTTKICITFHERGSFIEITEIVPSIDTMGEESIFIFISASWNPSTSVMVSVMEIRKRMRYLIIKILR